MDDLSRHSLMLKITKNNCFIGQATGFIVKFADKHYLVSNRHVFSGRDTFTNKPLSVEGDLPNAVNIRYFAPENKPEPWHLQGELLLDQKDGTPKWIDKPIGSEFADIAVLPLNFIPDRVQPYPLELPLTPPEEEVPPGTPVHIIGYPSGVTVGGGWPVWITGHIASDMELDHGNRPVFLVNANSTGGLSGSPVFVRLNGETHFLGVHSSELGARKSYESDLHICVIWRYRVLHEILQSIEETAAK